jgi:dnd system-associated protein 4
MAVIRVPEEAKPLLPLCRKHECGPTEQAGPPCFETYADLIVFAASYGFAEMNGRAPNRKSKFLERPNPIDLGIFKNDKRYPQILMIALAISKDQNVVRDEETICRLIEDLSAHGLQRLHSELAKQNNSAAPLVLCNALISALNNQVTI